MPSTEQNSSKNSRSTSLEKADQAGRHAALHGIAFEVFDRVQADLLTQAALQLPAGELGNQHFIFERPGLERERLSPNGTTRPVILVINCLAP